MKSIISLVDQQNRIDPNVLKIIEMKKFLKVYGKQNFSRLNLRYNTAGLACLCFFEEAENSSFAVDDLRKRDVAHFFCKVFYNSTNHFFEKLKPPIPLRRANEFKLDNQI